MTYPPQGGWGQPSGGYGQQPGPQPGGQYPPSGPQPGGQYPPQQGFGQPGWNQQPGGYGPQQPNKSKTGLIVGIAIGAVAVIGGIVGLTFWLTSGPGDPEDTAQEMVTKMNNKDFAGVAAMTCQKDKAQGGANFDPSKLAEDTGMPEEQARQFLEGMKVNATVKSVNDNGDDTATVKLGGTMTIEIMGNSQTIPLAKAGGGEAKLIVEDGEWKACS